MTEKIEKTGRGVEISDEILTFIVRRAAQMHHGSIVIEINADNPSKVDVQVVQKERFRTSEAVSVPGQPVSEPFRRRNPSAERPRERLG